MNSQPNQNGKKTGFLPPSGNLSGWINHKQYVHIHSACRFCLLFVFVIVCFLFTLHVRNTFSKTVPCMFVAFFPLFSVQKRDILSDSREWPSLWDSTDISDLTHRQREGCTWMLQRAKALCSTWLWICVLTEGSQKTPFPSQSTSTAECSSLTGWSRVNPDGNKHSTLTTTTTTTTTVSPTVPTCRSTKWITATISKSYTLQSISFAHCWE